MLYNSNIKFIFEYIILYSLIINILMDENTCAHVLKIMTESSRQIYEYKIKKYNKIVQTVEEKIEVDKIKTFNIYQIT